MTFLDIQALRKEGRLEEAYNAALEWYDKENGREKFVFAGVEIGSDTTWPKRALAWVYYDYLKKSVNGENVVQFFKILQKIQALELGEKEKMFFDNCAWQIGSCIFKLDKEKQDNLIKINEIFDIIRNFHFTKPSQSYTFMYKAFHKNYKTWDRYIEFAEWWNFDNFMSEDYNVTFYNNKRIMALVDMAYTGYSKRLIESGSLIYNNEDLFNEKVALFIQKLDVIIRQNPDYQYLPYFKAKLLLMVGQDIEKTLSAFIPFAKQRQNDFWVWDLMGEIFQDDKNLYFSCLCKGLSLKAPEEYVIKMRQKLAKELIDRHKFSEAKFEIDKLIGVREKNQWKIPSIVSQWKSSNWYSENRTSKNNLELYKNNLSQAEELLYQNIKEQLVAVEFVNKNKEILNFIFDKTIHGFFCYRGLTEMAPKVGDLIRVRLQSIGKDGFHRAFTINTVDSYEVSVPAIKNIDGEVSILKGNEFGFVEDIFIASNMLKANKLFSGQKIKGKAMLSYNKKKEEWGWKLVSID